MYCVFIVYVYIYHTPPNMYTVGAYVHMYILSLCSDEGLSLGINDSSADIFWDMAKNPEEFLLPNSTGRSNYTQAVSW